MRRPSSWWVVLYAWSLVALSLSCLILANAVAHHATDWVAWCWLAVTGTYLLVVWSHIRARDRWLRYGRLDEQAYVLESLHEAQRRGMDPSDWLALYWERCAAELHEAVRH